MPAKDRKQLKLEALRKQFGDKELEKTLNISPKIGSENVELFSPSSNISRGAEKLFKTFVSHVKASGHVPNKLKTESSEVNVVVKKKDADGHDVLQVEKIQLANDTNPDASMLQRKGSQKMTLLEMKKQLKKDVLAKKLQEMKVKEELAKLNNEEFDGLPEEYDVVEEEEGEGELLDDEEEEEGEEDDYEDIDEELEEDDVPMKVMFGDFFVVNLTLNEAN